MVCRSFSHALWHITSKPYKGIFKRLDFLNTGAWYLNVFRLIFERREVASIPWAAAPQVAVMLTLVLSQIIFYLLFPVSITVIMTTRTESYIFYPHFIRNHFHFQVSVQMLHPAGLNLSLLSANFITLGAAVAIFMYKVGLFLQPWLNSNWNQGRKRILFLVSSLHIWLEN